MSRTQRNYEWDSSLVVDQAIQAMEEVAVEQRLRVVRGDAAVTFKQGSRVLGRLLGLWFIPPTMLPKVGELSFTQMSAGCHVACEFREDDFQRGWFDSRTERRFGDAFDQLAGTLRSITTGLPGSPLDRERG